MNRGQENNKSCGLVCCTSPMMPIIGVLPSFSSSYYPPPPPPSPFPPPPSPCPVVLSKLRYALLLRGEIYRYGCDERGILLQDMMMNSQHRMITSSLEECGAKVDVLLAIDRRGCANDTLRERLGTWHPNHIRLAMNVTALSQPQGVRSSLSLYVPMADKYDVLIFARFDLRLLRPFRAWPGCQHRSLDDDVDRIGIVSRCEDFQWRQWNCSNDVLFVVPRSHFAAFHASMGAALEPSDSRNFRAGRAVAMINPNACFASTGELASRGIPKGLGHGCYNSLSARVGNANLEFCFPTKGKVTDRNDFYQCCRHGVGSLGAHGTQHEIIAAGAERGDGSPRAD